MPQKLPLLFLLLACGVQSSAVSAEPFTGRNVAATLSLIRMPQTMAHQFHLPVASTKSRGVQKIFTREEYRVLLQRFGETSGVEVLPMPRLVASHGKAASAHIAKELRFPTGFETPPEYPRLYVPKDIEAYDLGVFVEMKPKIQTAAAAYLNVSTSLTRLLGYRTPAGRLVRVSSPRPKSEWLQELTQWRMPSGVGSEPLADSSRGVIDSLLNNQQILLVHGFSDDSRRVTYFSVGLEILP